MMCIMMVQNPKVV
jgi:hypothetical protein